MDNRLSESTSPHLNKAWDAFHAGAGTMNALSQSLEEILMLTECRYGFIGELRQSDPEPGCQMLACSIIRRSRMMTTVFDDFPQEPVMHHSEDLFDRVIMKREPQWVKRPAAVLRRFGLLPEDTRLLEPHLLVLPLNTESQPRGLIGLAFFCRSNVDLINIVVNELMWQCAELIEISRLEGKLHSPYLEAT